MDIPEDIAEIICRHLTGDDIPKMCLMGPRISLFIVQNIDYINKIKLKDEIVVIDDRDYRKWYKNGLLHRDGDEPAVISFNGICKYWYKKGLLHRDGGEPAVILYNRKEWYTNNILVKTVIINF